MSTIRINIEGQTAVLNDRWESPDSALEAAINALPPGAPVVIMVHGLRFSPRLALHSVHEHIFSDAPSTNCWKAISWPKHLGFGRNPDAGEGLAIAIGWHARSTVWSAWEESVNATKVVAELIAKIQTLREGPIDLIGHSLGARIVLRATGLALRGSIGRVILLSAAAFRGEAEAVLVSPAGRHAEFFNITSRENDLFDLLLELAIRRRKGPALGQGLGEIRRNWLDIEIDNAETRHALSILGFRIPEPVRAICHWSGYLRPGLFPLYSALIRNRNELPIGLLANLLPETSRPRWSWLRTRLTLLPLLPFSRKGSM
jgi:pimeloyl-ACP methyl ester carboxylesterase